MSDGISGWTVVGIALVGAGIWYTYEDLQHLDNTGQPLSLGQLARQALGLRPGSGLELHTGVRLAADDIARGALRVGEGMRADLDRIAEYGIGAYLLAHLLPPAGGAGAAIYRRLRSRPPRRPGGGSASPPAASTGSAPSRARYGDWRDGALAPEGSAARRAWEEQVRQTLRSMPQSMPHLNLNKWPAVRWSPLPPPQSSSEARESWLASAGDWARSGLARVGQWENSTLWPDMEQVLSGAHGPAGAVPLPGFMPVPG